MFKKVVEIDERVRVLSNEKDSENVKNIQKGLSDSVEVLKEIDYNEVKEKLKVNIKRIIKILIQILKIESKRRRN